MKTIEMWKDPYCDDVNLCNADSITFEPGVTILVGCNGSGKTTLLHRLEEQAKKDNEPVLKYDNLTAGGSMAISEVMFHGDIVSGATLMSSSEGEQIAQNLGRFASKIKHFLNCGNEKDETEYDMLKSVFGGKAVDKTTNVNRWILLDAIDSGYSIDNILELKRVFGYIMKDSEMLGVDTYIIAVANEYELANDERCLDVYSGEYVTFKTYDEYKDFVLNSRKKKEKRYEKIRAKAERKDITINRDRKSTETKISKNKNKYKNENILGDNK